MRHLCQDARSSCALGVFDLQLVLLRLACDLSMILMISSSWRLMCCITPRVQMRMIVTNREREALRWSAEHKKGA